jgi:hypothetical protein
MSQKLPDAILKQLAEMSKVSPTEPQKMQKRSEVVKENEDKKLATTCSHCNQNRTRVFKVRTPSGVKRYQDDKGRWWRGKKCPDCVKVEHRNYMRGVRGTKNPRV